MISDPNDLARAASDAVGAWCAANPAGDWPAEWVFERGRFGPHWDDLVQVTYTTVRDQAHAILDEDDVLQQCIADLVAAGAEEGSARAAIVTIIEHALTKGIIRVERT